MVLKKRNPLVSLFIFTLAYGLFYCYYGNLSDYMRSYLAYYRVSSFEQILPLSYPYQLPLLPYAYDALAPYLDEATLILHHKNHHQGYIDKLNKALSSCEKLQHLSLIYLLTHLSSLPEAIQADVRNNGGGHFTHTLYWYCMVPESTSKKPSSRLIARIEESFGSFDNFQQKFFTAAVKQFNGGWAWLCVQRDRSLTIVSTSGHDTPLEDGLFPILVSDVWEHAYYLKFNDRRPEYVTSWWNVINWEVVEKLYDHCLSTI